nr:ABC transporter G family member 11 [Ipomoea batatas]
MPGLAVSYRESNWTPEYDVPPSQVWTLQPGILHESFADTFPSLGKRILDGEVSWSNHLNFDDEFSFTKGYWEWAEDILSHYGKVLRKGSIYDAVYASLFTYDRNTSIIQAFCEAWCPLTNTLVTSQGEVTISLRDLHILGGLPLLGEAYDERIPTALELNRSHNSTHFYKSCSYLLAAFHHLSNQEVDSPHVCVSQWIEFWCRKSQRYQAPPARKETKGRRSRPKATYNPSGIIDAFEGWSSVSDVPFVTLGLPRIQEEEIYLAAFLACWLCVFVLPSTPSHAIRPETFRMACIMAQGRRVCLAVPVLASIYHGLNLVSRAISPGFIKSTFPYHYLYGWLSAYLNTHFEAPNLMSPRPRMVSFSGEGGAKFYSETDARKKIFKGESINWLYASRNHDRDYIFHDDGKGIEEDLEYFLCLRPCRLILRQGQQCVAEPYTPHRFSRQFGFYQAHAPGCLALDKRRISLDEGLKEWRQYAHTGSLSKATFPTNPIAPKRHHSSTYRTWLRQVNASLLEDHISQLIALGNLSTSKIGEDKDAPKKDKEAELSHDHSHKRKSVTEDQLEKNSDENTPSHKGRHWKRPKQDSSAEVVIEHHTSKDAQSSNQPPCDEENNEELNSINPSSPLEIVQEKTPSIAPQVLKSTPQASIFQSTDFFLSTYKAFVVNFWNTIRETLSVTPIDEISSLKESTERNIQLMKKDGIDLTVLEKRVADFFERAQGYDQIRFKTLEAASQKVQDEMLPLAEDALTKAQEEYSKLQELLLDHRKALADSNGKLIKRSKAQLKEVNDRKQELEDLITEAQQELDDAQVVVSNAEEEVLCIQNNTVLIEDTEEHLNAARNEVEAHKADLMNLNLF